jgi:hypothetical protein
MPTASAHPTRRFFLASLALFAFSLVLSVTTVVTVFSVPLRTERAQAGRLRRLSPIR